MRQYISSVRVILFRRTNLENRWNWLKWEFCLLIERRKACGQSNLLTLAVLVLLRKALHLCLIEQENEWVVSDLLVSVRLRSLINGCQQGLLVWKTVLNRRKHFCPVLKDMRVATKGEARDVACCETLILGLGGVADLLKSLNEAIVTAVVNFLVNLSLFVVYPVKFSLKGEKVGYGFRVLKSGSRAKLIRLLLNILLLVGSELSLRLCRSRLLSSSVFATFWRQRSAYGAKSSVRCDSFALVSHSLLNPSTLSVSVVCFRQSFLFKALEFSLPHLENISFDCDVEARLCIAPESLVVSAVQAAKPTSKHTLNDDGRRYARLFALLL